MGMEEVATNVNGDRYLISWRNVQIHCKLKKKKEKRKYNTEQKV